jgi:hypothetical protein
LDDLAGAGWAGWSWEGMGAFRRLGEGRRRAREKMNECDF